MSEDTRKTQRVIVLLSIAEKKKLQYLKLKMLRGYGPVLRFALEELYDKVVGLKHQEAALLGHESFNEIETDEAR